jgi:hypothetical protein
VLQSEDVLLTYLLHVFQGLLGLVVELYELVDQDLLEVLLLVEGVALLEGLDVREAVGLPFQECEFLFGDQQEQPLDVVEDLLPLSLIIRGYCLESRGCAMEEE